MSEPLVCRAAGLAGGLGCRQTADCWLFIAFDQHAAARTSRSAHTSPTVAHARKASKRAYTGERNSDRSTCSCQKASGTSRMRREVF